MSLHARAAAVAAAAFLAAAAPAAANVALTRVSSDPFANTTSQHATEVEPDTFAFGATVVGAFQVGRFFNSALRKPRRPHRGLPLARRRRVVDPRGQGSRRALSPGRRRPAHEPAAQRRDRR